MSKTNPIPRYHLSLLVAQRFIRDYDEIMGDRKLFNKVVYTPLSEALRLLDERRKDPVLMARVEELLK